MQFPDNAGRRPAILDLSSPEISITELAALTHKMRNAQHEVEYAGRSALWTEITLLRYEVRAEFIRRYLQKP
jgi:hypothetical protein